MCIPMPMHKGYSDQFVTVIGMKITTSQASEQLMTSTDLLKLAKNGFSMLQVISYVHGTQASHRVLCCSWPSLSQCLLQAMCFLLMRISGAQEA